MSAVSLNSTMFHVFYVFFFDYILPAGFSETTCIPMHAADRVK